MDRERHARLQELFLAASELSAAERARLLESANLTDDVRADLERLLDAHDRKDTLLGTPVDGKGVVCPRCGTVYPSTRRFCETDGEPLVDDPNAIVGSTLDGLYKIEALVGRGGMGTVYRARHILLRDAVAIKVLPRGFSEDARWLARFQREGQAARRFRHPNAVAVHDLRIASDGTVYLVLEYVEGRTLRAELRGRSRMSLAQILDLVAPIASVLDAAHGAGVIHRDVKPENVMLGTSEAGDLVVKLLDLGVAKMLEAPDAPDTGDIHTREGAFVGTPRYMSPEQWGEPQRDGQRQIDGRTDVYALGVMVYEIVCGRPPFTGETWQELRHQHTREVPSSARDVVPDLPPLFARVLARALSKDRGDRFASAGEFARALAASVQGDAVTFVVETSAGRGEGVTGEIANATGELDAKTEANPPANLPAHLSSFVGREREVAEVRAMLDRSRLVTVAGPGGIGKTRIAVRAASEAVESFPGGVWFVDLAPIVDPRLVARTVVTALGVRERPDVDSVDLLQEYVGSRRLLVVLDNCEHLVRACASLVATLTSACPAVRFLATSREVLDVAGEEVWNAPPLDEFTAVRLFAARARAARASFTITEANKAAVAELCGRLEGIPLAVELAAARIGVLTPAQMLARFEQRLDLLATRHADAPSRHRTLRASIEWSYGLLDDLERRTLAALSVFRGGWTLEAAEAVAGSRLSVVGSDLPTPQRRTADNRQPATIDVLDVLDRLRSASLVVSEEQGEEMRYRMLESIREFAAEQLGGDERTALARRHAEFYAGLVEGAEPELKKANPEWISRLDAERDNLRAALERSRDGDVGGLLGLRLASTLGSWWGVRGYMAEGRAAIDAALARAPDGPPALRAKALMSGAAFCIPQADYVAARRYDEEALALWRSLGDRAGEAWSLHRLSNTAIAASEYERAAVLADESFAVAREIGDEELVANALMRQGMIAQNRGHYDRAGAAFEQALALLRAQDRRQFIVATLYMMGDNMVALLDFERAEALYEEALVTARAGGHAFQVAGLVQCLGDLKRYMGDYERAEELCLESLDQFRSLGATSSAALVLHILGAISRAKGDYARATERLRESLTLRAVSKSRRLVADTFDEFAAVAVATGRAERAARLLGAASALRDALDTPVMPADAPALDATRAATLEALGEARYEVLVAEGRERAFDEAVAEAVGKA